ncbi:MAG: hypothetical protein M3046_01480 [Actinomycetota bacterium]|jgi:hypothetical protein|nr:hypothetical protein [Actinomycetota bacterium]
MALIRVHLLSGEVVELQDSESVDQAYSTVADAMRQGVELGGPTGGGTYVVIPGVQILYAEVQP